MYFVNGVYSVWEMGLLLQEGPQGLKENRVFAYST